MALVSLLGLFLGAYLTMYKLGYIGSLACGAGSCEQVQFSRYGMFLGLPVSAWGLGFYLSMLVLSIAGVQERWEDSPQLATMILGMASVGLVFTAYLNYVEAFVINMWCRWCIVSALMVVVLFVLAVLDWRSVARRQSDTRRQTPGASEFGTSD
jgi:uncharacterized membrane protein